MNEVSQPQTDQSAGEAFARTGSIMDSGSSPMNYGSLSEKTPTTEEVFLQNLEVWGGPKAMLIMAWGSLVPIILPLLSIMTSNLKNAFEHSCSSHPMFTASRTACDLSLPGVLMFPVISSLAAFGLVSYRLVRQRLFYVFLRQRIFIDLIDETSFKTAVLTTLWFLFMLALVHFSLALIYTKKRVNGIRQEDQPLCPGSFADALRHPEIYIQDPAYRECTAYITLWVTKFIVPALIAIFFTSDIDDAESTLIPCSKLYAVGPTYVNERLSESIAVGEDVARDIVGSADFDEAMTDEQDISKLCEHFRITALSFEGVYRIGRQADEETADVPLKKGAGEIPTLWGVASRPWWPLRVILKDDMSEFREAMSFRRAWCGHCLVCFLLVGIHLLIRVKGGYSLVEGAYHSHARQNGSSVILVMSLSVPIMMIQAMALWSLLRSAWSNWY